MTTDAGDTGSRPEPPPRADLWTLPEILSVTASRVRYDPPRIEALGPREVREHREAVEVLVRTSGPLPARAVTPALIIGDLAVREYETVADDLYRFIVFDVGRVHEGDPIAMGWPEYPRTRRPSSLRLRFEEPGGGRR